MWYATSWSSNLGLLHEQYTLNLTQSYKMPLCSTSAVQFLQEKQRESLKVCIAEARWAHLMQVKFLNTGIVVVLKIPLTPAALLLLILPTMIDLISLTILQETQGLHPLIEQVKAFPLVIENYACISDLYSTLYNLYYAGKFNSKNTSATS